jgi:hypothetical protein
MADDTQQRLDALLGRALRDKDFRDKLVANPESVAKDSGLTPAELQLVAGGMSLGTIFDPVKVMWCTEKTCNEKGGARVVIHSPDERFNPIIQSETLTKGQG